MMRSMIFDGIPYREYIGTSPLLKRVLPFIEFLEQKLGVHVLYDRRAVPFERPDLASPLAVAHTLREAKIIKSLRMRSVLPDEPQFCYWAADRETKEGASGGASVDNDAEAIYATLAEGLERYLWSTQSDYFVKPRQATVGEIEKYGNFVAPEQFVSFSKNQRQKNSELQLKQDVSYLWIQGTSLIEGRNVYVPAQTISPVARKLSKEPLIRECNTNGLATWPTLLGARLAGALEIIERDAYMIMWFNQLTMPRISLTQLRSQHASLNTLVETCERYRLRIHAIRLPTDAPTHVVGVVIEDESSVEPRYTIGLKAHQSLARAIEKAALEALRSRLNYRGNEAVHNAWDPDTPAHAIGHLDRLHFWHAHNRISQLEFLIQGKYSEPQEAPWDDDTIEEHVNRILTWCKDKKYECISVSLGTSAMNPTPWHVEMVVVPDLQPTHLYEKRQHLGGGRLQEVPKTLGYTPRSEPFVGGPHPFY